MRGQVVAALALLCASPLHANGRLVGRVTSLHRPLAHAMVFLTDRQGGVQTDTRGRFSFDGVPPGHLQIIVFDDGGEGTTLWHVQRDATLDSVNVNCPRVDRDYGGKGGLGPGWLRRDAAIEDRFGTRCDVHRNERLRPGTVVVNYGLMVVSPGQIEAERDSFPNANETVGGGCTVEKVKYAEVAYCPACRRARDNWMRAHFRAHL